MRNAAVYFPRINRPDPLRGGSTATFAACGAVAGTYARTDGAHAKCYGPNTLGLKRRGFTAEQIRHIARAFRLLLVSKLNTTQALEKMKEELSGFDEIDYLIKFIESSKRGVTK